MSRKEKRAHTNLRVHSEENTFEKITGKIKFDFGENVSLSYLVSDTEILAQNLN